MAKDNDTMDAELKIRLPSADKDIFDQYAKKMRINLSAWLRIAGWAQVDAQKKAEKKGRG